MKQKSLWVVSIETSPLAEDAVSELLSGYFNQPCAAYTNLETGIASVTTYFAEKPDWPSARKILAAGLDRIETCGLPIGGGNISIQKVARENWAQSWKRHFQPIEIGDSLLVKPSWSKQRAKKNQSVVILDPGLSFGTGQHPTTSFCLEQVANFQSRFQVPSSIRSRQHRASNIQHRASFLDIGTGSGILAMAAAKLGFAPVEAFDFDPEAVAIARANARRNRVSEKILIHQADVTKLPRRHARRYSLVCANLISNLLISEQRRILSTLKPGGTLVVAGILKTEFIQVQKSYEAAGMKLRSARIKNEWKSGTFVQR